LPTVARASVCVSPPSPRLRWATSACIHERRLVGLTRFELVTPRLSSVCSNQLSYRPDFAKAPSGQAPGRPFTCGIPARARALADVQRTTDAPLARRPAPSKLDRTCSAPKQPLSTRSISRCPPSPACAPCGASARLRRDVSRKEVIQPQVLLQLPCYDFTPITNHTLGACLPCGLAQRLLVQPAFVM
jgi:hypothetical protein